MIHCRVRISKLNVCLWFTIVYGLNQLADRKSLWHALVDISVGMTVPWCIMGDFNVVFDVTHKSNGRSVSKYDIRDFSHCIEDVSLISPFMFGSLVLMAQ